jgi:hypothetical protein
VIKNVSAIMAVILKFNNVFQNVVFVMSVDWLYFSVLKIIIILLNFNE